MKNKILLLLISILLISYNSNSQSITENGTIDNGVYTCSLFDWSIKIPEGYSVRTLKQKEDLEKVGYESVKANTPEGVAVRQNRPHLIGFGLDDRNYFSSSFESLKGTKRMSLVEHQKFVAELISKTYSSINGIEFKQFLSDEKIGDFHFYKIQTELYNAKTKELLLTQSLYNTFANDHLFSVSINFTKKEVGDELAKNFINSLIK